MTTFERIATFGVVPVISIDDASQAVALADALLEGGLPVAEITFRTAAAAAAIEAIAAARPEVIVGAGTAYTPDQVRIAKSAGAAFALAPGLSAEAVAAAREVNLPYVPGIVTPSDLQAALALGATFLKFFPAMSAGGPEMLRDIAAPFLHTGVGFNPTGGVSPDNLCDWLGLPFVRAVGGTWIARRDDIATGNWSGITQKARKAVALARTARGN